jgi:hypothetical protein
MSVRLQGQLLLAGAIGAILASLLTILVPGPDGINGPNSLLANVVGVLSGLLLLVSLPVLSRAQAKQIGMLGLIGVVLLCIATVANLLVLTGVQIVDVARPGVIPHPGGDGPPPAAVIPAVVGVFALLIGGVIVGITMLRARVFARAIGWAIIITSVLLLPLNLIDTNGTLGNILTSVGFVLFYASLAWAGAVLISRSNLTQVSESPMQRS